MRLLHHEALIKTGPVDYAEWNYRPVLGRIQRARFSLAISLLPPRSHRLLEIGYGSGVVMPALSEIADQVYGIDVHDRASDVKKALQDRGVKAELFKSAAEELAFEDGFFNSIVA